MKTNPQTDYDPEKEEEDREEHDQTEDEERHNLDVKYNY